MVVMPTERDAETWSKDRFSPMARDTPCLAGKISDPKSRDGSNKILHKRFPGGHLTIVGANAPSGLASRPIRILLCDEVDRYPFSAGAEGDPVNLAKKRTVTFWNRKIVLVSTPTIRGASRIETAYDESDQRQYWVPCPGCGAQPGADLAPGALGQRRRGEHRPETARYHCVALRRAVARRRCAGPRSASGEWRARAPFRGIAGFHLNEIYSSWVRLEAMVRAFLSARAGGDEAMKTFVNTSLGETWMETGEAPDWQRLYERREHWQIGTVPSGRTVPHRRRRRAEGPHRGRRLGLGPRAGELARRSHRHRRRTRARRQPGRSSRRCLAGPGRMRTARSCGSPGSRSTPATRRRRSMPGPGAQGFAQVAPVKGVEGFNRASPVIGADLCRRDRGRQAAPPRRAALDVAVSTFKAETYRFLRLSSGRPTRRSPRARDARRATIHLPDWVEAEWLKQFVAEQLVTVKTKRGFARLEWQKLRERNEALDCRVYARAAAWIAGADRWSEAMWRDLEQQVGAAADRR